MAPELIEELKEPYTTPHLTQLFFSDVKMSKDIGELVAALAAAQGEFKPVIKDSKNPYYGSMYADLSSVITATQPALAKNGIVVIQSPEVNLEEMTLTMTSLLMHSSGQWLQNRLVVPATMKGKDGQDRFDAQSVGSASTYTRRYAYQSLVGVAAEADDDGNAAAGAGQANAIKPPQRKSVPAVATQPTLDDLNATFPPETVASPPKQVATRVVTSPSSPVTIPQVNRLFAIANAHRVPKPDVERYIHDEYALESTKALNREQYDKVVAWVEAQ